MIVYTPLLGCLQEPVAIALSRLPYVPYDEDRGLHVVGYALHVLGELGLRKGEIKRSEEIEVLLQAFLGAADLPRDIAKEALHLMML